MSFIPANDSTIRAIPRPVIAPEVARAIRSEIERAARFLAGRERGVAVETWNPDTDYDAVADDTY